MSVAQRPEAFGSRPFTRRDALLAGLTDNQLRGSGVQRLFRGVYVAAHVEVTLHVRATAAMRLLPPGAVLSHHTAAALRDLPVPSITEIHVSVPPDVDRPRTVGIVIHRCAVAPTEYRGLAVSEPAHNWRELAAYLDRTELVVLGDALVRRRLTTCARLLAIAGDGAFTGCVVARAAAALVRPRVASPPETAARLLAIDNGFPEPVAGFVVTDALGEYLAEVDLAWPAYWLIIEYDGDLHRTERRKWRFDQRKRDQLRQLGWTVIVLTADDLYRYPRVTIDRIARALRDGGWAPPAPR